MGAFRIDVARRDGIDVVEIPAVDRGDIAPATEGGRSSGRSVDGLEKGESVGFCGEVPPLEPDLGGSSRAPCRNEGPRVSRFPLRTRLQRTLGGELDATELGRLDAFVTYANGRGMTVIIDPHNFARYADQIVGVEVDLADFAGLWSRLAHHFVDKDAVVFGLMNEPHDMETEVWLEAANAAIAAIRKTGAKQLILVPGNGWTGAHNWAQSYYGTPNSDVMPGVEDPGDHCACEMHQYLDADSSGTGNSRASTTIGVERLTAATQWLEDGGYRGFLGEFGAPANDTCPHAMDELLRYVGEHLDVWMGWAVWAGGPWWGENLLTVQPRANGDERPQMAVLRRHLTTR